MPKFAPRRRRWHTADILIAVGRLPNVPLSTLKMKHPPESKRKPVPSGYQLYLRRTTIKLVLLFIVLALAVGAAFYFWQRHNLIP
jgi:hypothetical protein